MGERMDAAMRRVNEILGKPVEAQELEPAPTFLEDLPFSSRPPEAEETPDEIYLDPITMLPRSKREDMLDAQRAEREERRLEIEREARKAEPSPITLHAQRLHDLEQRVAAVEAQQPAPAEESPQE